jgi:hypothetical protein
VPSNTITNIVTMDGIVITQNLDQEPGWITAYFPDGGTNWVNDAGMAFDVLGSPAGKVTTLWASSPIELLEPTTGTSIQRSDVTGVVGAWGANGNLYLRSADNQLVALDPSLRVEWATGLQPAISMVVDCARNQYGDPIPGPGILYFSAFNPAGMMAVIVDDHGTSVTSPWPTDAHDPRRTNNSATPLEEFRCP